MTPDPEVCPVCGRQALGRCRCPRGDRYCCRKHAWHVCTVHGTVVPAESDHSKPTFDCTCPEPKDP